MNIYNIVPNPMTFLQKLVDAIYEYFDRYINMDDTYLSETSSLPENEVDEVAINEDAICTHNIVM